MSLQSILSICNMAPLIAFAVLLFCAIQVVLCEGQLSKSSISCSYFGGGRTPKEAYSLSNCTWYKDNACCERTEVVSVFKEMPALLTDNEGCYYRMNYLMCYFCSPKQQSWFNKSLSVCRSYCNEIYKYCASAKYDGFSIGSKYKNGVEFCEAQMFNVVEKECFDFDSTKFDDGSKTQMPSWLMLTIVTTGLTAHWLTSAG